MNMLAVLNVNPEIHKLTMFSLLTLFAGALPFTWEGDSVVVLEGGGAGGGGVGALAEVVDDDDGTGLLTLGLFSLSFSLPCELWV